MEIDDMWSDDEDRENVLGWSSATRHEPNACTARKTALDEFVAYETKTLELFKSYWQQQSEKSPEQYPSEFEIEDWDEQYAAYKSLYVPLP